MKKSLFICILAFSISAMANMASPILPGSMASSPFTSKYVAILGETIYVVPNSDFLNAEYTIEYRIRVDREGIQVPLLFYAMDYDGDFKVSIDGKNIQLMQCPPDYHKLDGTFMKDFNYFYFDSIMGTIEIEVPESEQSGFMVNLRDLKYFRTNMSVGEHILKVSYRALQWIDESDWVNNYSFRYALSPAKYWTSYGYLKITIDARNVKGKITTNLGSPSSGSLDSIANWTFDKLPTEIFIVEYEPALPAFAEFLIKLSPAWLCVIFSVIIFIFHLLWLLFYRKKNRNVRFSWVVISGSILLPLLVLIAYMMFFNLIDSVIGEHASGRHGYTFLILLLYPLITPFYWLFMWLVDRIYRRKVLLAIRA
jgi:hypothetical protein